MATREITLVELTEAEIQLLSTATHNISDNCRPEAWPTALRRIRDGLIAECKTRNQENMTEYTTGSQNLHTLEEEMETYNNSERDLGFA